MISASECVGHCSVAQSYWGLMTDPAHWGFEISLEILTAPFLFLAGKVWARREHRKIDIEHGVEHGVDRQAAEESQFFEEGGWVDGQRRPPHAPRPKFKDH